MVVVVMCVRTRMWRAFNRRLSSVSFCIAFYAHMRDCTVQNASAAFHESLLARRACLIGQSIAVILTLWADATS